MANLFRSITMSLIERLSGASTIATAQAESSVHIKEYSKSVDDEGSCQDLCLYYLRLILSILQYSPDNMWPALGGSFTSDSMNRIEAFLVIS